VPFCVDFHSVPSVEWAGYAKGAPPRDAILHRAASLRTGTAERLVSRRADAIIAAGEEVAADVQRLHRPATTPHVIPNGVDDVLLDLAADGPSPYANGARSAVATVPGAQSTANARALAFLQAVAADLHGREQPTSVHVLGSKEGPAAPGLSYEGFQPDLLPWIAHADVCLLPYPAEAALAGGARNKLLEYLARGRTIVSTREGLRGLGEVASWPGVFVTDDDPAAFAAAVSAAGAPDVPTLEASRDELRRRLRWDSLAERVRDVLAGIAR
jgi:glycosyltransferase involved in cell wall biosynthesis